MIAVLLTPGVEVAEVKYQIMINTIWALRVELKLPLSSSINSINSINSNNSNNLQHFRSNTNIQWSSSSCLKDHLTPSRDGFVALIIGVTSGSDVDGVGVMMTNKDWITHVMVEHDQVSIQLQSPPPSSPCSPCHAQLHKWLMMTNPGCFVINCIVGGGTQWLQVVCWKIVKKSYVEDHSPEALSPQTTHSSTLL